MIWLIFWQSVILKLTYAPKSPKNQQWLNILNSSLRKLISDSTEITRHNTFNLNKVLKPESSFKTGLELNNIFRRWK